MSKPSWMPSDEAIWNAVIRDSRHEQRNARGYSEVKDMIRTAGEKALAEQRQQFMEPPLAREQPCGCVVCVCDSDERCYGCGAKNCDDPTTCVLRLGDRTKRVYRDAPSYSGLLAKLAEQEARHRREVLNAQVSSLVRIEALLASRRGMALQVVRDAIDIGRAELAALDAGEGVKP